MTITQTRKVNIHYKGKLFGSIQSTAQTWGELIPELQAQNIEVNEKKIIIGENQNVLETSGAGLPASPFTLFIMNKKNKSGNEESTRSKIKNLIAEFGDEAKNFFSAEKSYTNKKEVVLVDLLAQWEANHSTKKSTATKYKAKETSAAETAKKDIKTIKSKKAGSTSIQKQMDAVPFDEKLLDTLSTLKTSIEVERMKVNLLENIYLLLNKNSKGLIGDVIQLQEEQLDSVAIGLKRSFVDIV